MKLPELLVASLLSCVPLANAATSPLLSEQVRATVSERVKAGTNPTVVIGVIDGDRQEVAAFGAANEHTIYEIGSITKTFTALLLAEAVERGEVSLDDPVLKLLPDFPAPKGVTLLDLATQSSGLPRLPDNLLPKDASNPYADYDADALKAFFAGYHATIEPGTHFEYSNLGFGLLGHALAVHGGKSYADLLKSGITDPLGMNETSLSGSHLIAGHTADGSTAHAWDFRALAGAGAIRSSAHDMLLYLRAMMSSQKGPLAKPVAMTTAPRRGTDDEKRKIGLAWMIEPRAKRDIIWHNGMTGGYAAFVGFTADGSRGVVALTNVSRDITDIGMMALVPEATLAPKELPLAKEKAAEYSGRYALAPGFELVIRAVGNELQAAATGQGSAPIFMRAPDEFFYEIVDAQISFKRGADGKVTSLVLHQNGRDMPAPRVGDVPPVVERKEIETDPARLQAYAGTYPLAPGFALQVTVESGQLYVQATGQPRVPVYASAPDQFFYKVVDAQLTFLRDAGGAVKAVVLHQNGRDVRGEKK